MALGPWQRDIGEGNGRLAVTDAPAGDYVFELGNADLEAASFNVGDYIEVSQTGITFDGQAALVRVQVDVVLPSELPTSPALEWEFTARLNGAARYTRRLAAEPRVLSLQDIAIPTVAAVGSDTLAFRLELVNA